MNFCFLIFLLLSSFGNSLLVNKLAHCTCWAVNLSWQLSWIQLQGTHSPGQAQCEATWSLSSHSEFFWGMNELLAVKVFYESWSILPSTTHKRTLALESGGSKLNTHQCKHDQFSFTRLTFITKKQNKTNKQTKNQLFPHSKSKQAKKGWAQPFLVLLRMEGNFLFQTFCRVVHGLPAS